MAKRILCELRQSIPTLTPFEMRKRVMLQAAWSSGHSIFAHEPTTSAEEKTRKEIVELYRQLAEFVLHQAEGGNHV